MNANFLEKAEQKKIVGNDILFSHHAKISHFLENLTSFKKFDGGRGNLSGLEP